jgi:hypothetical protein
LAGTPAMGPVAPAMGSAQDGEPELFNLVGPRVPARKTWDADLCLRRHVPVRFDPFTLERAALQGPRPRDVARTRVLRGARSLVLSSGRCPCALRGSGVFGTRRLRHEHARQGPAQSPARTSSAGCRHQRLTGAAGPTYIRSMRNKWIGCRRLQVGGGDLSA